MSDVTRLLQAIEEGDPRGTDELLPVVYSELRQLAAQKLADDAAGTSLTASDLVHEAYLRLVGTEDPGWRNRRHFFGAAAEAMRRVLVERARQKRAPKHGGGRRRVDVDATATVSDDDPSDDLLAVDEALGALEAWDPAKAQLVKLRYFVGLTHTQAAGVVGVSEATAKRHWRYARAWLLRRISEGEEPDGTTG